MHRNRAVPGRSPRRKRPSQLPTTTNDQDHHFAPSTTQASGATIGYYANDLVARDLRTNRQTWTLDAAHEAHITARLSEGHHYNKSVILVTADDEDPRRCHLAHPRRPPSPGL